MQACFHSVGLPELPILDVLDRVKGAGYAAVELNAETLPWAQPHVTPATPTDMRRQLKDKARQLGLAIPAIGAHIGMVEADAARRAAALQFVLGCIDLAADLGAPIVHVLSGPREPATTAGEARRRFSAAVARAAEHAGARGVTLAIEAIAGHAFHGVDDYHALRRDLPGVPWKVNFDPSHLIVQGENPMRVVDELAGEVVHVHLKDGAGHYPDFTFPPLGEGEIDFPALARGLDRAGYCGAMSVEYEAQVYGFQRSDEEILRHGREFLAALKVCPPVSARNDDA